MKQFFKSNIKSSEITPEQTYLSRRKLLKVGGAGLGALALAACSGSATPVASPAQAPSGTAVGPEKPAAAKGTADELGNKLNSYKEITNYNNYYEFSTDKEEVATLAASYTPPAPFKVEVTGLVGKAMTFDLDDLKKKFGEEERVYRLRCVEGWSMVIPWMGFSLAGLLKAVEPTSAAKFVRFYSHHDSNMPGNSLDWPYVEGLRLDEAMNELALMVTGLYGKALPVQNGAPVRLALPWFQLHLKPFLLENTKN